MSTKSVSFLVNKKNVAAKKALENFVYSSPQGKRLGVNSKGLYVASVFRSQKNASFSTASKGWAALPAADKAAFQKQADENKQIRDSNKALITTRTPVAVFIKQEFKKYDGKGVSNFFKAAVAKFRALPDAEKQALKKQVDEANAVAIKKRASIVQADAAYQAAVKRINEAAAAKLANKAKEVSRKQAADVKKSVLKAKQDEKKAKAANNKAKKTVKKTVKKVKKATKKTAKK